MLYVTWDLNSYCIYLSDWVCSCICVMTGWQNLTRYLCCERSELLHSPLFLRGLYLNPKPSFLLLCKLFSLMKSWADLKLLYVMIIFFALNWMDIYHCTQLMFFVSSKVEMKLKQIDSFLCLIQIDLACPSSFSFAWLMSLCAGAIFSLFSLLFFWNCLPPFLVFRFDEEL